MRTWAEACRSAACRSLWGWNRSKSARLQQQIADAQRPVYRSPAMGTRAIQAPSLRGYGQAVRLHTSSLLVLDFASVPAEIVCRIPLSTWFRFRAACERTRTTLVLLTQHSCAKASAEMAVHIRAGEMQGQSGVLTGIRFALEVERQRTRAKASNVVSIRKPPQSERGGQWHGRAAWAVRS